MDNNVSVIVPVYKSETTLRKVLDGLESQTYPIDSVFIINNNPDEDICDHIVHDFNKISKNKILYIKQNENKGLAESYNEGIRLCKSKFLITLQSDVFIPDHFGIEKLINAFKDDDTVVASCSLQETPLNIWYSYNFWQKALFSRHTGRPLSGRNGRFCCYKIDSLKAVNGFDGRTYHTAGEDGDINIKLSNIGNIVDVPVVVMHLHDLNPKFGISDYYNKENQLAQAAGALLANHMTEMGANNIILSITRPLIAISSFIPHINIFTSPVLILYGILVTKRLFLYKLDPRLILLYFVNLFMIYSYSFYFIKGFLLRKQC